MGGPPKWNSRDFDLPFIAIAANGSHNLGLRANGTVIAWGNDDYGQATVPGDLSGVTAIAAGELHSIALKRDGTVAAWGLDGSGATSVPSRLTGVTAIAAGCSHSVALKNDGTVVAWGNKEDGITSVPAGLTGVTAIAAGYLHTLALKSDGTVVSWGSTEAGMNVVPEGLSEVTAIAAGLCHNVALKADGTVVAWGNDAFGQITLPPGLTNVASIAASYFHTVATKTDGTVVAWGRDDFGQSTVPTGLSGVSVIAAGYFHSAALKTDGSVIAWGNNDDHQTTLPPKLVENVQHRDDTSIPVKSNPPGLTTSANIARSDGVITFISNGGALGKRLGTMSAASFAAKYEALLVDSSDFPAGKLRLSVAKSGKSFSGSMALAGETKALRVSGPIVTNSSMALASGTATVLRNGVTYALDFFLPMHGEVTGTLTRDGSSLATAQGGRRLLKLPNGVKVNYSGAHTVVLEPAQPPGVGVPAGAGWARATISTRGALALAGKLGDGTVFTTSLLPDAQETPGYRLWIQPYKPARKETYLGGLFSLSQHPSLDRGFVPGDTSLVWAKAMRLEDKSYPEGFLPLSVNLTLDPWTKPTSLQPLATLLGLSGNSIKVQHSTVPGGSDDNLPTTVTLSLANLVSVPGTSNPTNWKARLNTSNGTFTGSFERLDAGVKRLAPFSGVLRQPVEPTEDVIGDGHFLIPEAPGALEKGSGEVLFKRP